MPLDYENTAAALANGVSKAVAEATEPLLRRIEQLEAQQSERGEKGERGEAGDAGRDGVGLAGALIDRGGELVVTFSDGTQRSLGIVVGNDGDKGEPGESIKGDSGDKGDKGETGESVQGEPGEKGDAGDKGDAGLDAYPGEARGLYDASAEYRARDVVAHNSSAWMAKTDDPGELPGDGWMLLAGRGKRGEPGDKGERGMEGKSGKDGAQPVALKFDAEAMQFVMVLDSGEVMEADLEPVLRAMAEVVSQ